MKKITLIIIASFFLFSTGKSQTSNDVEFNDMSSISNYATTDYDDAERILEEEKRTSLLIYPNPSTGPFTFQSNVGEIEVIELYSQNGQLLFTSGSINRKDAYVDLSAMKSQTIIARVQVNGRTIQKILIKK
ncbi:MAG: hypothetical protein ACJAZ2_001974 [Glaciecola sp.]|jgi:hypothetical protein